MSLPPLYRAARCDDCGVCGNDRAGLSDDRKGGRRGDCDSKSCRAGDSVQGPEKVERVQDSCFVVNDYDLRCRQVGDQNSQVVHDSLWEAQLDGGFVIEGWVISCCTPPKNGAHGRKKC